MPKNDAPETDHEPIVAACCLLLAHAPWYGHAATKIDWQRDDTISTMGVYILPFGTARCVFSQTFVNSLTRHELAMVIQHEIEHVVRQHCKRILGIDRHLANIACDMVVNGYRHAPFIGLVEPDKISGSSTFCDRLVWLPDDWERNLSIEQVYQRLIKSPEKQKQFQNTKQLDSHDRWDDEPTSDEPCRGDPVDGEPIVEKAIAEESENEVCEADLATAARILLNSGRKAGVDVPRHLADELARLEDTILNWKSLLRSFVRRLAQTRRISWNRRSRRLNRFGMPGSRRIYEAKLAVIIDVSSSVTEEELTTFFGELEALTRFADFCVLGWHKQLAYFVGHYSRGDWKELSRHRGGGTDMVAPINWLVERNLQGDGIVMLTD